MGTSLRYTYQVNTKSGKVWRFDPPEDTIRAGIVKRESFRDGRTARVVIPRYIEQIDAFRRGELAAGSVGKTSTLAQVIAHYRNTEAYNSLADNSKRNYDNSFIRICDTSYGAGKFGDVKIEDLTARMCTQIYDGWAKESIPSANSNARVFSVIMSFCISLDMIPANPMSRVKKLSQEKRSITWTKDQVKVFLDKAFSDFRWRNIGLLVYMAYEWCQRPVDIRYLMWDNLDLDAGTVKIKQRKRGAEVELPIDPSLLSMLKRQKEDYGFQQYVVPQLRKADNVYRPYTRRQVSRLVNEVLEEAGLPEELRAGDLRKTGIMELVEAGADSTLIMSVSGHKDLSSLSPYMKHTLAAATKAMDLRRK